MKTKSRWIPALLVCLLSSSFSHGSQDVIDKGLWFFVLVKSSNYAQSVDGELTLLNYHFFSEIFAKEEGIVKSASLKRVADKGPAFIYENKGDTLYYEGGHFDTMDEVDAKHPNGKYQFNIELNTGEVIEKVLSLAGPDGQTDIPDPITIYFFQNGKTVSPNQVNHDQALKVRWSPYSNGQSDPNGIVDDMIFVVFQNCHGDRIFHTGLPFEENAYMTFETTEVTVPAGSFEPGQAYSMFVEFPHVVESGIAGGVPGFTSYATATYLDVHSLGERSGQCPEKMPPLDTGQTDRMELN